MTATPAAAGHVKVTGLLDNAMVTHDSAAIYDELMMTAEDRRHQTPGQRPRQGSNLRPTA
jgi:hypothetical protein